jgi:hypothetical protein
MDPAIPILGLVAALLVAAALRKPDTTGPRERNRFGDTFWHNNDRETRRTIAVNLSILLPELDELDTFAAKAHPSTQVDRAKELLRLAREATESIDSNLRMATSSQDLADILGQVFAAMTGSSDARRLLGACHPLK